MYILGSSLLQHALNHLLHLQKGFPKRKLSLVNTQTKHGEYVLHSFTIITAVPQTMKYNGNHSNRIFLILGTSFKKKAFVSSSTTYKVAPLV